MHDLAQLTILVLFDRKLEWVGQRRQWCVATVDAAVDEWCHLYLAHCCLHAPLVLVTVDEQSDVDVGVPKSL